ncbi:MAG: dTMP kinase [Candidatus Terrybacteria bacterium RIFCSPLOWO2_01_FULL_40_23]|uniref:Thymidylate kinase n=1 Tax=Candidatus Terrybacteria bacterium RIFCSPLOWO2_01_FULL_40_23 TaxID=1802366 RepID=A0A1G2PT50_9BACT|nr:MAG: dTMP kinase [Candidatus Terrybacteria bacterium RIFCSPLOWO2_01_FULL_40_23]
MKYMINSYPGIFIVLEGIDRSGKHTQGEFIQSYVNGLGFKAYFTQEPWWGEMNADDDLLKKVIKREESADYAEIQKLFIDNRARHLEHEIIPYLKNGSENVVICERYFLSTLAYGPATGGGNFEELWKAHELTPNFIFPDLTLIIDISAEEAVRRLDKKADVFEESIILEKVRQSYLSLAIMFDNVKTVIIDGAKSPEEVFASLKPHIEKIIKEKKEAFGYETVS